jgi:hypothetical protein
MTTTFDWISSYRHLVLVQARAGWRQRCPQPSRLERTPTAAEVRGRRRSRGCGAEAGRFTLSGAAVDDSRIWAHLSTFERSFRVPHAVCRRAHLSARVSVHLSCHSIQAVSWMIGHAEKMGDVAQRRGRSCYANNGIE